MSTLYLIRHGQASFLADDYDVLSPRGIEQSRALGRYLADRGIALDAIYSGPRKRQLDTATQLIDAARDAGAELPAPSTLDAFDEYPFDAIMTEVLPRLADIDPELGALAASIASGDPGSNGRATMSKLIERVTTLWSNGELRGSDAIETYDAFRDRVFGGLDHIMRTEGRGKRVAVVTSGGPISLSLRRTLGLDHHVTWRTAWVIRNASITELLYRDAELSLASFNATPHLGDALITYR